MRLHNILSVKTGCIASFTNLKECRSSSNSKRRNKELLFYKETNNDFLSNERNVLQNRMYYQGETKPSSIKLELIYSFYRRIRVQ